MERDLRHTTLYREIEDFFKRLHEPGFGRFTGALDPAPSPDGRRIAFTGTRLDALEGVPQTRIGMVEVQSGDLREITSGPNSDRLPAWSPDGRRLAFLSDRRKKGRHQVFVLDAEAIGEAATTPEVPGSVERAAWSPDGRFLLIAAVEEGADKAGAEGSGVNLRGDDDMPSWLPDVESSDGAVGWRRLHLHEVGTGETRALSREGLTVWEAAWCGDDSVAAIVSESPDENAWYDAPLVLIDRETGSERELYRTGREDRQIGLPTASPDGGTLAFVEALCSDRAIIAGDLRLIDPASGSVSSFDTAGVDVASLAWRDAGRLLIAGLRNLDTVIGEVHPATGAVEELWVSEESSGTWYPYAAPIGGDGVALVLEGYDRPPEIAVIREGKAETLASLANDGTRATREAVGRMERVSWEAPDGLEIHGLLIRPEGVAGPHPLVTWVHGGPVGAYRNRWLMGWPVGPLLVSRGYAVFMPNPRGSSGRGQDFAAHVRGDMGGADAQDVLSGVDALVERGVADPARLGVTGGSYGGFMTAWLVTRTDRFAAAVSIAPVADWYSQHWGSNIGRWDRDFLLDDPSTPGGAYHERSPVVHAAKVTTPTLLTAGLQDRCTPPGQAIEFYRALREHGAEAALAVYPEEGHGVRQMPAAFDFLARLVGWFERFMPAKPAPEGEGE